MPDYLAPHDLRIGHVHLKVSDLHRSITFYREILGFELRFQLPTFAFLSVGGYHHHIGLNTWESSNGKPAPVESTGLYHFALNYPTEKDLGRALKSVVDHRYPIEGAADHVSHLAIYLQDPDGNGIELAWDRGSEFWEAWGPTLTMDKVRTLNTPVDLQALLKLATE
ncbi:VOC family protein [Rhizobium sp. CCGE 510]|uniref:VOC family protein n=1 Tax=Rhizobium sp. CCGE 510 TaxID=1132836 RepID=UPI00027B8DB7|nr:VOC family protein [Rhizobium sp. CCGE 510]EJT06521.1 Glyoxalase/bleomycin resistance protein/dioxygenase [Rhizobium sp. CCGE 510]